MLHDKLRDWADKVYGPYTRKDGRKHVVLVGSGRRSTVSYPKWLIEQHLGRILEPLETVDHKNRDFTDDRIENLRVISRPTHAKEDAKWLKPQVFLCPVCGTQFPL